MTTVFEPMNPDELWSAARDFHGKMADELPVPSDMLGVIAIIMTNSLAAAVMSGLPDEMALELLDSIKTDVVQLLERTRALAGENITTQ
jgi:hypothetical protein